MEPEFELLQSSGAGCAAGLGGTTLSLPPRGLGAQREWLVLIYMGKRRVLFLYQCLFLPMPESPSVSEAWGQERGNRVGDVCFS